MTAEEYTVLLKGRLNEKRFRHSLNVAEKAKELSIKYGADPEKMYLAGLLHDITKNTNCEEQLKLCDDFGIIKDDIFLASPDVWHAFTGAAYVENVLGIKDDAVISAIRYHTTGKAGMSKEEKIVFIADLISADRCYPDIETMREKAEEGLDGAMLYALVFLLGDLSKRNKPIHPLTLEAYNYFILNKNG